MQTGSVIVLLMALSVPVLGLGAERAKPGGLLGNSYASEMDQTDASHLVITARKRISGDLKEVNTPGTTMYNALRGVQTSATARAVIEANALGYEVIQIIGWRDLTSVTDKRNASAEMAPGLREKNFSFAPGHYSDDIELALELTIKLVPGSMPANPARDLVDVKFVLVQLGLADVSVKPAP